MTAPERFADSQIPLAPRDTDCASQYSLMLRLILDRTPDIAKPNNEAQFGQWLTKA